MIDKSRGERTNEPLCCLGTGDEGFFIEIFASRVFFALTRTSKRLTDNLRRRPAPRYVQRVSNSPSHASATGVDSSQPVPIHFVPPPKPVRACIPLPTTRKNEYSSYLQPCSLRSKETRPFMHGTPRRKGLFGHASNDASACRKATSIPNNDSSKDDRS